eukprot:scaffold241137_cov22-Tisochrysis_lutea.AAC.1
MVTRQCPWVEEQVLQHGGGWQVRSVPCVKKIPGKRQVMTSSAPGQRSRFCDGGGLASEENLGGRAAFATWRGRWQVCTSAMVKGMVRLMAAKGLESG